MKILEEVLDLSSSELAPDAPRLENKDVSDTTMWMPSRELWKHTESKLLLSSLSPFKVKLGKSIFHPSDRGTSH